MTEKDAKSHAMLGTVQVNLQHGNPWNNSLRALCDTGSQINLISYDAVKRLDLHIVRDRIQLMEIQILTSQLVVLLFKS